MKEQVPIGALGFSKSGDFYILPSTWTGPENMD